MSIPLRLSRNCLGRLKVVPLPLSHARFMSGSGRENCSTEKPPRCSSERLAETACAKEAGKKKKRPNPFKSMWDNPACCNNPCPDAMPRFDELYWSISDKAKRKYMQTWVECPRLKIAPRKICCFESGKYPPLPKRPKNACPKTACNMSEDCKPGTNLKCRKVTSPGCRGARDPPKCKKEKSPSDCKKICAPYPSFSECSRKKPKPLHPVECKCLAIQFMCDVWAELRRRGKSY